MVPPAFAQPRASLSGDNDPESAFLSHHCFSKAVRIFYARGG
ncbi:MAG TPA: hypothetical protein PKV59_01015 [Flexilinea sp.]|nr:hypothetical protein [Flexilinea sp.]